MDTVFIIGGSFIIAYLISIFIMAFMEIIPEDKDNLKVIVPAIAIMILLLICVALDNKQQRSYHKVLNKIYNETSIEDVQKDIDEYYESVD